MKKNTLWILAPFLMLAASTLFTAANSDETIGRQISDKAGDITTDSKKANRSAQQRARKARGTDNLAKDAKDKANDSADDAGNSLKKLKNKVD